MELGDDEAKKGDTNGFGKNLNLGIRRECQKLRLLVIFSETDLFQILCMIVEGNKSHNLSMVPYLEKILIWD